MTNSVETPEQPATAKTEPVVHTQGPWAAAFDSSGQGFIQSAADDSFKAPWQYIPGITVAVLPPDKNTVANGHLIAAAPELLTMCQTLLRRELEVIGSEGSPFTVDDVLVKEAQALIAKATRLVV